MTHQVGRAEAGVREEKPLPVDKARGRPFFCIMVYAFGVLSQEVFRHSCYKDILQQFIRAKLGVFFLFLFFFIFRSDFNPSGVTFL